MQPHRQGGVQHQGGDQVRGRVRGELRGQSSLVLCSAPSVPQPVFTITEKAPTSPFTFKTLLRPWNNGKEVPRWGVAEILRSLLYIPYFPTMKCHQRHLYYQ